MVAWVTLVLAATCMGAAFVGVLVTRRTLEPPFAFLALGAFAASAWAFGTLAQNYVRLDALFYAFAFAVAASAGGYALASTLLWRLALREKTISLPSTLPADNGTAAVIVLGIVEPASYDERWTASTLIALAEEELLEASAVILPFLFLAAKARYRAAGGSSPGVRQLEELAERLGLSLPVDRVGRVWPASTDGTHALDAAVVGAVAAGHRKIVIVQALVAGSLELDEAKRKVDSLRLAERGIVVTYTDGLWGSERVASLVTAKVLSVAHEVSTTGVLLVGIGQPEPRSRTYQSFDEREQAFLSRVRMLLIERGVAANSVRLAWSEWRMPDVTSGVRHLAALGCSRLIVVPACFPLDSIATLLDLPMATRQARVEDTLSVVTLHAWGDDNALVAELREQTLAALEESRLP